MGLKKVNDSLVLTALTNTIVFLYTQDYNEMQLEWARACERDFSANHLSKQNKLEGKNYTLEYLILIVMKTIPFSKWVSISCVWHNTMHLL